MEATGKPHFPQSTENDKRYTLESKMVAPRSRKAQGTQAFVAPELLLREAQTQGNVSLGCESNMPPFEPNKEKIFNPDSILFSLSSARSFSGWPRTLRQKGKTICIYCCQFTF